MFNLVKTFSSNSSSYAVETPSDIRYEMGRLHPQFKEYDQQDSYEFFLLLIDAINKEMHRGESKLPYKNLKQESKSIKELVSINNKIIKIRVMNMIIILKKEKIVLLQIFSKDKQLI